MYLYPWCTSIREQIKFVYYLKHDRDYSKFVKWVLYVAAPPFRMIQKRSRALLCDLIVTTVAENPQVVNRCLLVEKWSLGSASRLGSFDRIV